jgi:cyclopropane-fatty-acyl-phospholipid synthase
MRADGMTKHEALVRELLRQSGITLGGPAPHDLHVHDARFFERVVADGSLGLGESYMDGWWSCGQLDEFFCRLLRARVDARVRLPWRQVLAAGVARVLNRQSSRRASQVATVHYDLGAEFFEAIMDARMAYSCGYWKNAQTLADAQEAKLDLTCRKLQLAPTDRVLDIGCGWGSFVTFAAERYGCASLGVTISAPQAECARRRAAGMPVTILRADYREIEGRRHGRFDKVVSIGMFEHVGPKNYRTFMRVVDDVLARDGLFLLHTIGDNVSRLRCDPWLDRYIFPNGVAPSVRQIARAIDGLFVMEDWHNFGPDYYPTLMAWCDNLRKHFAAVTLDLPMPRDRFFRMWEYFFTSFASAFKTRQLQLWQIVMSKSKGARPAYASIR